MIEFYQLSRDYQNPNQGETHPYYPPEESGAKVLSKTSNKHQTNLRKPQTNLRQTSDDRQTSYKPQTTDKPQTNLRQTSGVVAVPGTCDPAKP